MSVENFEQEYGFFFSKVISKDIEAHFKGSAMLPEQVTKPANGKLSVPKYCGTVTRGVQI